MKSRLRRLVEERRRRLKSLEDAWRAKREAASHAELSAGELANMLEGLTPDGYDREGRRRRVGNETGESLRRRGISASLGRGFWR